MSRNDIVYGVCGLFDGISMEIAIRSHSVFHLPSLNYSRCDYLMIFVLMLMPWYSMRVCCLPPRNEFISI